MDFLSLNCKVNLPRFCKARGIDTSSFTFKNIPIFGWFAYDGKKAKNLFDTVDFEECMGLYKWVTENPSVLDCKLDYHQATEVKIWESFISWNRWQTVYLITQRALYTEDRGKYKREFEAEGYAEGLSNHIGLMTPAAYAEITAKFKNLDLPASTKNKFIIPSWATPNMICSLEAVSPQNFNSRHLLYKGKAYGWYGNIHGKLVNSIVDLTSFHGFTWDDKCVYWKPAIEPSEHLDVTNLMKLWITGTPTTVCPLDTIINNGYQHEIPNYLTLFKGEHIKQIFDKTGVDLKAAWSNLKLAQTTIGNKTFIRDADSYKLHTNYGFIDVANFAIELEHIKKGKRSNTYHGVIFFKEENYPFSLDSSYMRSPHKFSVGIRKVFEDYSIGIPIINPAHEGKLLTIVNSFNQDVTIV